MTFYKAFTKQLQCRDMTYQYGEHNIIDRSRKLVICEYGIHFCDNLLNCLNYYPLDSVFYEILPFGEVIKGDGKYCCYDIILVKQITEFDEDFYIKAVKQNGLSIEFIENPSENERMEADKQLGWSIP